MASSSLVDDTAVALTDEEEAWAYWAGLYWTPIYEDVVLWNQGRIVHGTVEVFSPGFYQLNYVDEFASYDSDAVGSFPWIDPTAGPLSDDEASPMGFYQLDYLDEFASYTSDYLDAFPWDPTAGPKPDDFFPGVYVASQAGYIALVNKNLIVASQAAYVSLISQKLVVSSQTAYVVLLANTTKNYSQAMMGTF